MTFWGVLAFWLIVIISFVAGAVHGRGIEQGRVIDAMERWGPNCLTRLERMYGVIRDNNGFYISRG